MRGHVRKRGNAWELRAYAGIDPLTNRQKYVTRTFRGGKREAEEALARFVTEVAGGSQAAQDTTVGDLIRDWLALAKRELSPTTARGYDWIVKTYIIPTLGKVPLARLRTAQLDRFYAQLREKGGQDGKPLSAATVRQVHAILRRALEQGIRWGWITTNPAALASPPKVRASQPAPPEPKDVVKLIQGATAGDPDFGCFVHLAATTGARRGELCGLRWRDVDLDSGSMTISRNVVEGAGSAVVEKDTKTHASRRIALDPDTVTVLKAQRKRLATRATGCGVKLSEDAHVFSPDPDGVRPRTPNDVTKAFIRVRKRAGMDTVRLHDLRHFAATHLLAAGVPVRTVSGRLGHANAATTLGVYAHFVEESDREAAAKLGALLVLARPPTGRPNRATN
ncbi:MAG: tyrosine-type recombinase/integrase [Polyangiaceae bacterium]